MNFYDALQAFVGAASAFGGYVPQEAKRIPCDGNMGLAEWASSAQAEADHRACEEGSTIRPAGFCFAWRGNARGRPRRVMVYGTGRSQVELAHEDGDVLGSILSGPHGSDGWAVLIISAVHSWEGVEGVEASMMERARAGGSALEGMLPRPLLEEVS